MRRIIANAMNDTILEYFPTITLILCDADNNIEHEYEFMINGHHRGYINYLYNYVLFHSYSALIDYKFEYTDHDIIDKILNTIDTTIIQIEW